MSVRRGPAAGLIALFLLAAGCSVSPAGGPGSTAPLGTTSIGGRVRLQLVATAQSPVDLVVRHGDPALYVAEQSGRVVAIRRGAVAPAAVLDLTGQIVTGGEQGLLG